MLPTRPLEALNGRMRPNKSHIKPLNFIDRAINSETMSPHDEVPQWPNPDRKSRQLKSLDAAIENHIPDNFPTTSRSEKEDDERLVSRSSYTMPAISLVGHRSNLLPSLDEESSDSITKSILSHKKKKQQGQNMTPTDDPDEKLASIPQTSSRDSASSFSKSRYITSPPLVSGGERLRTSGDIMPIRSRNILNPPTHRTIKTGLNMEDLKDSMDGLAMSSSLASLGVREDAPLLVASHHRPHRLHARTATPVVMKKVVAESHGRGEVRYDTLGRPVRLRKPRDSLPHIWSSSSPVVAIEEHDIEEEDEAVFNSSPVSGERLPPSFDAKTIREHPYFRETHQVLLHAFEKAYEEKESSGLHEASLDSPAGTEGNRVLRQGLFRKALTCALKDLKQRYAKHAIDVMVSSCLQDDSDLINFEAAAGSIARVIVERRLLSSAAGLNDKYM